MCDFRTPSTVDQEDNPLINLSCRNAPPPLLPITLLDPLDPTLRGDILDNASSSEET